MGHGRRGHRADHRAADHAGANTVLVSMNRGAMPQEMFMQQMQRFGAEVLPALQAHQVTRTLV